MSSTPSKLTLLLPTTPYVLAYSLPLLLLSVLLTFAGTFLTIDRSRSFTPRSDASNYSSLPGAFDSPKKKRRFSWLLEGGIGGLASGYAFGLHLSTLLVLLIPATSSSAALSSKSFVAVWILSCIVTTFLSGRYSEYIRRHNNSTLFSLSLCVILHPSLTPRVIFTTVITILLTILVLISTVIPRLSTLLLHPLLRLSTASTGAFGLVLSIALLAKPQVDPWANIWERLWVQDGDGWGSGKEQGMSAAWGVFLNVGMIADWALHRWLGECPDERWDSYLATYTSNLPNQADRAGTFQPLTGFWDRWFPSSSAPLYHPSKDIIFPSDSDMKKTIPLTLHDLPQSTSPLKIKRSSTTTKGGDDANFVSSPLTFLKKSRSNKNVRVSRNTKGRKPVRFGAINEMSSDSDSDIDEKPSPSLSNPPSRPSLSYSTSSTPTLVEGRLGPGKQRAPYPYPYPHELDYDEELAKLKSQKLRFGETEGVLDYSDYEEEEDLTVQKYEGEGGERNKGKEEGWSPGFLRRLQASSPPMSMPMPGAVPVPATPSLIKAVDRIAVARKEAYRARSPPVVVPGSHRESVAVAEESDDEGDRDGHERVRQQRAPRWEEFWREVRTKAQS
ncbi:uncharacterized protein LACBIDRAFT_292432 [Laccaria bicolor S238N-H82]|uniref:Predicted protein n=1 Tax=Laccaria bicolor (strain S238N-H82 / ATCC MYA-4686) TaxID=486041 RepID=B0CX52_LACBS|nr:uncharacterized protein LACBIDRAFT_292432 [Laccaria bicolor S238N-H82]EDR13191.1 predicted protein [Laccaria bicolor S238N-H82]|eukprot:XP_001875689.1 predicted protein [Laccaria bicolor S238N-H82]